MSGKGVRDKQVSHEADILRPIEHLLQQRRYDVNAQTKSLWHIQDVEGSCKQHQHTLQLTVAINTLSEIILELPSKVAAF